LGMAEFEAGRVLGEKEGPLYLRSGDPA
jgi:hypothetical protein